MSDQVELGGEASTTVAAPPAAVWAVVSDVTRVGEWSPECRKVVWLDGASGPAVGARFRGTNRRGMARWSTNATIVRLEPERAIAYEVRPLWGGAPASRWTYELAPADGGTLLTERFEVLHASPVIRASWVLIAGSARARMEMLRRSLPQSLERVKALIERQAVPAGEA